MDLTCNISQFSDDKEVEGSALTTRKYELSLKDLDKVIEKFDVLLIWTSSKSCTTYKNQEQLVRYAQ